jgi:hypothetical protein
VKKVSVSLAGVLLLVLALVAGVSAGGNPPPSLSTGFQVQNRSTTDDATVAITYYDASGALVESDGDTIPANASKAYYVPNVLGQPDGRYSVVLYSSQGLFTLVNEVTATGASPNVEATHSGFSDTEIGSPLYLPWVVCGYYSYNSMIAIQNAGDGDTNVTVEFYQSGQSTAVRSYTFDDVHAGGAVFLDMTANPYKADLQGTTSNGFYGAVKLFSTGDATPLAAVLNDTNPTGGFLRSYNAVKGGSTDLVAPQVTTSYYGFNTGITLQNPDAANTAHVEIRLYKTGEISPTVEYTSTVAPSSATGFYLPNIGTPAGFNGTAVVHSDIPVIGIANHDHVPAGPAASYNMIPVSEAQQTLYMPQVVRAYYGFETGYQVYNVGPEEVTIEIEFFTTNGSTVTTIGHTIPAGSSVTSYLGDTRGAALGTMFNGGAKVSITSGNGGLIGIANFVSPYGGDYQRVYNMFY